MALRIAAYLHRNRRDTYYFRRAVPPDLLPFFNTREIYRSLATRDHIEARYRALTVALQVEAAFRELRRMPKSKKRDVVTAHMMVSLNFDVAKGLTHAKVEAEPHEEEMARRLVPHLLAAAKSDATTANAPSGLVGEKLSRLVHRYCEQQREWQPHSREDIKGDLLQIADVAGDPISTDLTRPMLSGVLETMLKLPANIAKRRECSGKSYTEILALDLPPQATSNVKKKWARFISFLNWTKAHGFVAENHAEGMKPRAKARSYAKFTDSDLRKIFGSSDYIDGSHDEAFKYWVPVIALFTGARLEEICQLRLADVRNQDGIACIEISEEIDDDAGGAHARKHVKTRNARVCPLHPKLVELGLIKYAEDLGKAGYDRLFPELRVDASGKVGGRVTEWFTAYRRTLGVGSEIGQRSAKAFHSFRHTMIYQLQLAGVPQDVREQLAGHKSKSINVAVYGGAFDVPTLAQHLAKLSYPVTIQPYRASAEHEAARKRAAKSPRR